MQRDGIGPALEDQPAVAALDMADEFFVFPKLDHRDHLERVEQRAHALEGVENVVVGRGFRRDHVGALIEEVIREDRHGEVESRPNSLPLY